MHEILADFGENTKILFSHRFCQDFHQNLCFDENLRENIWKVMQV